MIADNDQYFVDIVGDHALQQEIMNLRLIARWRLKSAQYNSTVDGDALGCTSRTAGIGNAQQSRG